jgi:signal transduction histidine kinase
MMQLVLRDYYADQELEFLYGNANALKNILGGLLQSDLPEAVLQDQVDGLAFLSQTQIRLMDAYGNSVVDSGVPRPNQVVAVSSGPFFDKQTRVPVPVGSEIGQTRVLISSAGESFTQDVDPFEKQAQAGMSTDIVVPVNASPYGYGFVQRTDFNPARRSTQAVSVLLTADDGRKLGVLEFSNGPSYGADVIQSVTTAWLIASVFAIAVAALTGWYMSKRVTRPVLALEHATQQMERGDLSVRVALKNEKQLEFLSLANTFNGMAEQVEKTVSTLRAFVADAAHELNTPITALQTDLQLARASANSTDQGLLIERIEGHTLRLERLVRSLLDLSRLEGNIYPSNHEPVDLTSLAQSLGEIYASQAEQSGIDFRLEIPGQAVLVSGDPSQLRAALENLLDNALKFTPTEGMVNLRLEVKETLAVFSVEDTGIGIPPEDLPYLFQRFHRGRNSAAYPGNGLGLAIVSVVADAHGGRIRAGNTERGSIFWLELPLG